MEGVLVLRIGESVVVAGSVLGSYPLTMSCTYSRTAA